MESPQKCPVADAGTQLSDLLHDLLPGQSAQDRLAEAFRHALHFRGNCGIMIRQVGMRSARCHNNERISLLCEIIGNRFHFRMIRIPEVHGHEPACGAGHLVQQA